MRAINLTTARPLLGALRPDMVNEKYYSFKRDAPASARIVLTVYDMIHEKFAEMQPEDDLTAQRKATAIARAEHIICSSQSARDDLTLLWQK